MGFSLASWERTSLGPQGLKASQREVILELSVEITESGEAGVCKSLRFEKICPSGRIWW